MRYIKGIDRKRSLFMPGCIDEYISEDNQVRVIDAFVISLDVEKLEFTNAVPPERGRLPFDPRDIIKLYIYGYMNGITSSRLLEDQCHKNVEVMWLLNNLKPDFKTISDFRKDNKEALQAVFKYFVMLCKKWDLYGMELIAIDGSKFRACNSKKKNYNDKTLDRKTKYLNEKIDKYMTEIEENDNLQEDSHKPSSDKIKKKVKELKKRKETYECYKKEIKEKGISEISTTDPDSRLMNMSNNSINVCYNVQTVVDSKHSLIVDCNVINNPTDYGQLSEMGMRAKKIFGVKSIEALADTGYSDADDLIKCDKERIVTFVPRQSVSNSTGEREFYTDRFTYDKERNVYICPLGHELACRRKAPITDKTKTILYKNYDGACSRCESRDKCTKCNTGREIKRSVKQDFVDIVNERTKNNMELYKKRQAIVEHPFGTLKRGLKFLWFLTKGLDSVGTEVSLAFLAYNMKRVSKILGVKELKERLISLLILLVPKRIPYSTLISVYCNF